MAARISIPVFEEGVFHANMDATALVNTLAKENNRSFVHETDRRGSHRMDEAKSRELVEWIQEEAISKFRERHEVPESRLMSMRWVLTWKLSDEHPQGRKAKAES